MMTSANSELMAFRSDMARLSSIFAGGTVLPPRGRYTFRHSNMRNLSGKEQLAYFEQAADSAALTMWDTRQSTDLEMLVRIVTEIRPTILITGMDNHWPRNRPIQGGSYCALSQQLDRVFKRQGLSIKIVLRTNGVVPEVPRNALPTCYCCSNITVYDVWSLSQMVRQTTSNDSNFFTDKFHYQPWVYDKLNSALIRLLGYSKGDVDPSTSNNTSSVTCSRPSCADCRTLWKNDKDYGYFHCKSCKVEYMKPSDP